MSSPRSQTLRSALRGFFVAPPLWGAVYVLGLAAWAGRRANEDDADLGDVRRAEAIAQFVEKRFAGEITRMTIGIIATAIGLGLALGLVADVLMRLRHPRQRLASRHPAGLLVEGLALVAGLHASLVFWSMAKSPQLYASRWYAKGGLARTAQVISTDVFGGPWIVFLLLTLLFVYVSPSRVVELGRRVRDIAKDPRRFFGAAGRAAGRGGAATLAVIAFAPSSAPPLRRDPPSSSPRATAGGAPSAALDDRPNVIVLAADSLRADHVDARVAPTLAGLAQRGTLFEHAYVSMPRTFPSWVTILTGRHGHHHGIRSMFPSWEERAKDFDALPSRLARAGYATGVVSDYAGDIFGRIDLGFDRVDTPSFDFRQLIRQRALERETPLLPVLHSQLGRRVFPVMRELNDAADPMFLADDVEKALGALSSGKDGAPFFLTVFFSTAHFPYAAPAPYYAKFTDRGYRGRFKYHKPVGLGGEAAPDAADIKQIRALYDGTVNAIDDAAARILRAVERRGIAKRTIIVVTADHGETLYDHDHGQGHGDHLFGDEGTHVPLVVFDPRVAPPSDRSARREPRVVRDVDIAATLYELTGVTPPPDLDGRSVAPALVGAPIEPRFAYAESELWFTEEIPGLARDMRIPYPGIMALTELDSRHNAEIVLRRDMVPITLMARHRMVRDERYKLVYVPTRAGVRYMLFDTKLDPGETRDVSSEMPAEVVRLKNELWGWMLKDPVMEQKDGFLVPREGAFRRDPKHEPTHEAPR